MPLKHAYLGTLSQFSHVLITISHWPGLVSHIFTQVVWQSLAVLTLGCENVMKRCETMTIYGILDP